MRDGTLTILAPAKVNLFLELQGKRQDGFHEIETLMCKVGLYDRLCFSLNDTDAIELQVVGAASADIPTDDQNLVVRAAKLLQASGRIVRGTSIRLVKHIPSQAGLGGGSSDAAATLIALRALWDLDVPDEQLHEVASEIGSDVPFFLYPGAAICRGRGELVTPFPLRGQAILVITQPPVRLSTAAVYGACPPTDATARRCLNADSDWGNCELFNRLEVPAASLTPWLGRLRNLYDSLGVARHQMSGSGSAYFGLCGSAKLARRVASRLRVLRVGDVYCAPLCR